MIQEYGIDIWQFPESDKETVVPEVLSGYVGIPAEKIEISSGQFVKPALLNSAAPANFHFNISHSAGIGILAVSGMPVGIDIEEIRDVHNLNAVIELACTPEEQRILSGLNENARPRLFFELWARKEACVKMLGEDILPSAGQYQCIAEDAENPGGGIFLDMFWQDGDCFFLHEPLQLDGFTAACCIPVEHAVFQLFSYRGFTP